MTLAKVLMAWCVVAALSLTAVSHAAEEAAPVNLAALLEGAANGGYLKIPPGVYRCEKTIALKEKKNLFIDGDGVTVLMTKHVTALEIRSCVNLVMKGFTIDYDPLPFTQATLTSYDPVAKTGVITLMKGYPRLDQFPTNKTVMVFDAGTKNWKRDSYGLQPVTFEGIDRDTAKITMVAQRDSNLAAGDLLVIERRDIPGVNIVLTKNLTIDGLVIHAAPGVGIIGRYGAGQQIIRNVRIERGPKPPEADCERLFSTGADGLNYAICRQGPTVLNCDFGFMGDDGINFHGEALPVHEVESETSLLICRFGGKSPLLDVIQPGDKALFMDPESFAIESDGIITGMELVETRAARDDDKDYMRKLYPPRGFAPTEKISTHRPKFEKAVTARKGQWLDVPALNCPGYSIIGNRFHDHRGRGVRIMAQDGVIAGNLFERLGQSALSIGAEYNYWREAGWCRNIVIARNVIKDCGIHVDATMPAAYACGAISVFTNRGKDDKKPYKGHENIVVDSNIVEGNPSAGIHVYGVRGALITNNLLSGVMRRDTSKTGSAHGLKVIEPITCLDSEEVVIRGNTVQ